MKKWPFLFLIAIAAFSCEDDNVCGITEQSDEVFMAFFNYETKELLDADFDSVAVFFQDQNVFYLDTAFALPIDVQGSFTDYMFYTDSTDYDLRINYRSQILIDNEECDPVFRISALEASSEELDSISIKVVELSKLIAPHVEIYF